jgi:hypothetical protein
MRRALNTSRLIALLCSITSIVACTPPEVSGTVVVQTEGARPEDVIRTAQVLTARFEEILPTMRSTVSPTVTGNTITFTFRGEAPKESTFGRWL